MTSPFRTTSRREPVHLDDLETQLLATAEDLVQIGGRVDAAAHDRLGRGGPRFWVSESGRKGGAQVAAHTDLVVVAHLRSRAMSELPPLTGR